MKRIFIITLFIYFFAGCASQNSLNDIQINGQMKYEYKTSL